MTLVVEPPAALSGAAGARRSRRPRGRRLLGLTAPLVLVAVWQLVGVTGLVAQRLMPTPTDVATATWQLFFGSSGQSLAGVVPFDGAGLDHLEASTGRCLESWLIAVVAGTTLGLLLGLSRLARDLLEPMLNALRAVPLFAWLPLVLVWFGIGEGAARSLIFVGALWPVLVAVADSTARVPRAHVETARMLGAPTSALWRSVYLPSALPEIVTGLRLSLTLAWTCVIVGELTGTDRGLGAMMNAARETGRTDQVVSGIVVFAAVGLLFDVVLRRSTRRWVAWTGA